MFGKIIKSLFYMLPFWLFVIMLFTINQSNINTAGAVSSNLTKTVNFYGSDNETVIYSLDVPYGETLTSFTAVNPNSSLINNTNTNFWQGRQLIFDYYALTTASSFVSVDDNGFVTFGADTTGTGYLINILDFDKFAGKTCTATINYNNNKNLSLSVTFPTIHDGVTKSLARSGFNSDNIQIQLSKYASSFGLDAYFCVQVDCLSGNSILLNYIKVEFGSSSTPYFNTDYVNKLYINSGGAISSNFVWSKSPYTNIDFDFNSSVYLSTDLYYIKDIKTFTISASWSQLSSNIQSIPFLTSGVLQSLQSSYNNLFNLNVGTTIPVIKELIQIGTFIWHIFELLMLVASLLVVPIVDIFSIVVAVLYNSLVFWV